MSDKEEEICNHFVVSIKEFFEVRISAIEKATGLAKQEMDRRLEGLNELRREVTEDRGAYLTRESYDVAEKERVLWRESVNTRLTAIETRSITWTAAIGMFFVFIQIAASVILYFLLHK